MKKRIVCVLLTLIMLLSLIPMGASAASHSVSAAAITVLKQMTTLKTTCYHFTGSEFRTGYGTVCEEKHYFKTDGTPDNTKLDKKGNVLNEHTISETQADTALREALKALDEKVNNFASSNGKNLSQNQHDALVVFSYNAGSDWMNGNGVVKTAILNDASANELLNAMYAWTKTSSNADMNRRKVEVNMYMNGIYSTTVSTNYIKVTYNAEDGSIPQGSPYTMYYDGSSSQQHVPVATHKTKKFLGWYGSTNGWVPVVHSGLRGANSEDDIQLYAHYMNLNESRSANYILDVSHISPKFVHEATLSQLKTAIADGEEDELYDEDLQDLIIDEDEVTVYQEFLDENGDHWCRIGTNAWVKVSTYGTGYVSGSSDNTIKWTVEVTNSYVNRRVNASTTSAKNGSYTLGAKLDIIDEDDGWLQVGETQSDGSVKAVGWVCAIYTNWGSVYESSSSALSTTAIGTATVTFPGYLNVRQEPGTDGKIVGALAQSDTVDIYEIRTVNGHRWGRTKAGWICLTYTSLNTYENVTISDEGLKLYSFTGEVKYGDITTRVAAGPDNNVAQYRDPDDKMIDLVIEKGKDVTINNLVVVQGETWAKATWQNDEWRYTDEDEGEWESITVTRSGWVKLPGLTAYYSSDPMIVLDPVKYNVVADSVNVRDIPDNTGELQFALNKGTQVEVNQIVLNGENIWGLITTKNLAANGWTGVESDLIGFEVGWINLASKYVSRDDVPTLTEENNSTDLIATVINTDSVRVRKSGSLYATVIGSLTRNTTVAVWEEDDDWYKVDSNQNGTYDYSSDGWVSGDYLDVRTGSMDGSSTVTDANGNQYETDGTGKGIVANTYSGLNVRTGPGTGYATNGKLLPGTVVEILETANAGKWGRTAQGWVSMDYITMVSYNEVVTASTDGSTVVDSYENAQTTTTTAVYTGYVAAGTSIFRSAEENASEVIRTTTTQENVTVYELAKVTKKVTSDKETTGNTTTTTTTTVTTYWARINDGWVQDPETCIYLNALDEQVHTLTGTETLKVREIPETGDVIDKLAQGDQVVVTALEIVNDKVWGRIETDEGTGWIRLDYMSEGAITVQAPVQNTVTTTAPVLGNGSSTGGYVTNTSGYRYTGKVIRANEVNVRATASTTAAKTTTLKNGQALVIYETMTAENMAWGRCDAGWIYLYYVDLTPVVNGAVDARVVYNENTIIYTDVNCSAVAGTYSRMSVVDIYEIVGKMARTELGWVNTDNLL